MCKILAHVAYLNVKSTLKIKWGSWESFSTLIFPKKDFVIGGFQFKLNY